MNNDVHFVVTNPFDDTILISMVPSISGMASQDILANERPIVGNCTMLPENGTALETEFNIFCEDWADPDLPLNFRFAQRLLETDSWTWMYSGKYQF